MSNSELLGRAVILPLSLIEVGLFIWYSGRLRISPRDSTKRVLALGVFLLGSAVTMYFQGAVFAWITSSQPMGDRFFKLTLAIQNLSCIGIGFFSLVKFRSDYYKS